MRVASVAGLAAGNTEPLFHFILYVGASSQNGPPPMNPEPLSVVALNNSFHLQVNDVRHFASPFSVLN